MAQQRREHVVTLDEPVGRVGYQSVVAARLVLDGSGFALEYTTSTEDNVRDPFTFSPGSWRAVDDQGHHYTAHEAGDWSVNDLPPVREVRFRGAVAPNVRWLDLELSENESAATIRIVLSDGGLTRLGTGHVALLPRRRSKVTSNGPFRTDGACKGHRRGYSCTRGAADTSVQELRR